MAKAVLEMFQDVELVAGKRCFKAIGKADQKMPVAGRGARDDTHRAARMHQESLVPRTSTSDTTWVPADGF